MKSIPRTLGLTVVIAAAIATTTVAATPAIGPDASRLAAIPNADRVMVNGHHWPNPLRITPRGSALAGENAFGQALAAANNQWTSALCNADSDGDGFTNGEELGDPSCVWTPGAAPARVTDISNPGERSSVPTTSAYTARSQTYTPASCTRPGATLPSRDSEGDGLRVAIDIPTGVKGVSREAELAQVREPDADDQYYTSTYGACPHQQASGLSMWHDAATWGGTVPAAGSDVTLPAGVKVLVTSCSLPDAGFGRITIPATSELIFDDAPVHLRAKAIDVNGGMYIGSKECPIKSPITITLSGTKAEMSTYNNGINVLGSGKADFFGWTQERTWTRLKTTAAAGHFKIVTLHPTTWAHGDEIVIATSIWKDTEKDENEVRRIVARDSTNSSILLLDRPLNFKHYAGHEYQSEVALLTRTIMIRGGTDSQSMNVDYYGGHTWAIGPDATYRMVGVRAERMGQRNVMARYPFHFHMMYEGGNGNYFQQCAVTNSYYRGYTIHGTNRTLVRKNVAYNTTGHTYYLEDGGEMFNTLEFNIAIKVAIIGSPASDGAQSGQTVTESDDLKLPADITASGFYLSNAHNWVRGNAASGGWAGFAFPVFDSCVKLSSQLTVIPKEMRSLEFDGNTCHSSGHHWGAAGCVYAGGRLWFESDGLGRYTHGRTEHPTKYFNGTKAWQKITNLRAWLTQKGYSSWGERVDITNMECHDCTRTAVLFGSSSVVNTLYNAISENRPADMRTEKRTAFQLYDTWVQTMLVNVTLRNIYTRPYLNSWERPNAGIVDITHSDIFKPWGISAVRDVRFENSDRRQLLGRLVRESGASRMFNIMDWDGSFVNSPSCEGQIIGSEIDWWNAFDDCWWEREWMAWVCPRKPGREVVGIDADFGDLQERLDIQPSSSNGYMLTQSQRDQLYIGHISYFGSNANKKLIITKNHHLATGISSTAWYMWVSSGLPETFKLEAKNFPRGAYILMAIGLPSDAMVTSITTEKRWGDDQRFAFTSVASRAEVLNGNGTQYHFDGRHLYIKMSDLYSTYPNQYSRGKVDIYNVYNTHGFYTINLNCPSKNPSGRCNVDSSAPDPPSDITMPITTCSGESQLEPVELCPSETDITHPSYPTMACSELTWQCSSALPDHCRQSCLPDCQRLAPYPYTCSLDRGCEADEKPPAVKDWCAALTSTAEVPTTSDPCHVAWCNQTANSTVRFQQSEHHPCTDYDDGGVLLEGRCSMGERKCKGTSQVGRAVKVQPLTSDPTETIEASVTVVNGTVSSVVAHYRLAHEGQGLSYGEPTVVSSRQGAMSLVSSSPSGLTHHYRLSVSGLGGAVSGNVTFVVSTSEHGTQTLTVTDWRDVAKVNVVVDEVAGSHPVGSLLVNVRPIDLVVRADLLRVNPHTKTTLETVAVAGTTFNADHTVKFDFNGGTPPEVGASEALAVKVTLTSGTTMQATVPCAIRDEGSACDAPVLDARDHQDACQVKLEGSSFNNWWLSFYARPDASAVTELIGVQASGNKTLTKNGDSFGDNPFTSLANEAVTVVARYADGKEDVFSTFSAANFPANGEFLRCVRGSLPNKDHLYADRIPTPAATGACVARRCRLGMAPFTTSASTTTTTTAAATTTTSTTAAATTTTTEAATTTTTTTTTEAATQTTITTVAATTTTATPSQARPLDVTFESRAGLATNPYTHTMAAEDFGDAGSWNDGLDEGRVTIQTENQNTFLRVAYPSGIVGSDAAGAQFKVKFDTQGQYSELYVSYRIRFKAGFDFVKGGKIPGLCGGECNTGGRTPDGYDGWSARGMWRRDGHAVQYLYYMDQPGTYAEDLDYLDGQGNEVRFVGGQWHTIITRVRLNTPGSTDGIVEAWMDGAHVLSRSGLRMRMLGNISIDTLYFSTFFGGSDSTWASTRDETIDFDDFIVSSTPIGATTPAGTTTQAQTTAAATPTTTVATTAETTTATTAASTTVATAALTTATTAASTTATTAASTTATTVASTTATTAAVTSMQSTTTASTTEAQTTTTSSATTQPTVTTQEQTTTATTREQTSTTAAATTETQTVVDTTTSATTTTDSTSAATTTTSMPANATSAVDNNVTTVTTTAVMTASTTAPSTTTTTSSPATTTTTTETPTTVTSTATEATTTTEAPATTEPPASSRVLIGFIRIRGNFFDRLLNNVTRRAKLRDAVAMDIARVLGILRRLVWISQMRVGSLEVNYTVVRDTAAASPPSGSDSPTDGTNATVELDGEQLATTMEAAMQSAEWLVNTSSLYATEPEAASEELTIDTTSSAVVVVPVATTPTTTPSGTGPTSAPPSPGAGRGNGGSSNAADDGESEGCGTNCAVFFGAAAVAVVAVVGAVAFAIIRRRSASSGTGQSAAKKSNPVGTNEPYDQEYGADAEEEGYWASDGRYYYNDGRVYDPATQGQ